MNILTSIKDLFSPGAAGLVCPRCEKSLEGHDEAACSRKMSRRFFFQVAAGAAITIAVADPVLNSGVAIARASRNEFLTITQITNEMLCVLHKNTTLVRKISQRQTFLREFEKIENMIGDTIAVRRPRRVA